MSWIFGFIGASLSPSLRERLVALHDDPLHLIQGETVYIATGGLPHTCFHNHQPTPSEEGWIVVGLGLQQHDDHSTFLNTEAWAHHLTQPRPVFEGLDGHFVAIRWQQGQFEAFTDALGTRTLYLAPHAGGLAFSTRLDWLSRLQGGGTIDYAAFGTHWLTFNQLSTTCLVEGITRLGPGGRAAWAEGHLKTDETPWTPEIDERDQDGSAFTHTLTALVHPWIPERRALSLGLSGGLDSRLLLAARLDLPIVQTHVFGAEDHPDVQVARRIAKQEGLRQYHFHEPVPDLDHTLALLRNQVAHTNAVSAASSVIGLRYYEGLQNRRLVMIDGGLGEAARRQFMNRLLRRGRRALRSDNPATILPYLRVPRTDVFTEAVRTRMEQGAEQQIATLWETLPPPKAIGVENFVDLLGVRTRLPNFFGFEQNRLDAIIQNYMPFAQPSLLQAVFHTPLSLRRNGRLFRQHIRAQRKSLTRYPLIKGTTAYPFRLRTVPAYAWTSLKKRLNGTYTDSTRLQFLETIKPFALDALHSQTVRTYPAYDHAKLTALIEGYYNGQTELAGQVDWWLAFEMWRRVLQE